MFDNLTKVASIVPILAAIYFACRGFIDPGMTLGLVGILTVLFASLSWLLSQAILRFLAVRHNGPMATSVVAQATPRYPNFFSDEDQKFLLEVVRDFLGLFFIRGQEGLGCVHDRAPR